MTQTTFEWILLPREGRFAKRYPDGSVIRTGRQLLPVEHSLREVYPQINVGFRKVEFTPIHTIVSVEPLQRPSIGLLGLGDFTHRNDDGTFPV